MLWTSGFRVAAKAQRRGIEIPLLTGWRREYDIDRTGSGGWPEVRRDLALWGYAALGWAGAQRSPQSWRDLSLNAATRWPAADVGVGDGGDHWARCRCTG